LCIWFKVLRLIRLLSATWLPSKNPEPFYIAKI
jgi:hypothetical protein